MLFGSGVGASLITDGSPDGATTGGAPLECGHLTVQVRGRRCRCGALGCLEAYTGAESLLARWAERGGGGDALAGDEEDALAALLAAAGGGDAIALDVLDETAEYLGAGLSDVINLFQPERILIGGWAGLMLGPHILPAVREHATRYSLRHPAARVTIDMGSLGPDAVTVGAATLPLAAFFATGGRRTPPEATAEAPGWQTSLQTRGGSAARRG